MWMQSVLGKADTFEASKALFQQHGAWVILIKGLTPIPFKIVTIGAGAAAFDPFLFVVTAAITRAARFFLLAALLLRYGAPIREFIEKRLTLITTVVAIAIIGGFVALRYL